MHGCSTLSFQQEKATNYSIDRILDYQQNFVEAILRSTGMNDKVYRVLLAVCGH